MQRTLGAPNETEARRGSIFAGLLKLLPVFIFIIPGMIAFALAQSGNSQALASAGGGGGGANLSALQQKLQSLTPVPARAKGVGGSAMPDAADTVPATNDTVNGPEE